MVVASIKGGNPPIDAGSLSGDFVKPECCQKALKDEAFNAALKSTIFGPSRSSSLIPESEDDDDGAHSDARDVPALSASDVLSTLPYHLILAGGPGPLTVAGAGDKIARLFPQLKHPRAPLHSVFRVACLSNTPTPKASSSMAASTLAAACLRGCLVQAMGGRWGPRSAHVRPAGPRHFTIVHPCTFKCITDLTV